LRHAGDAEEGINLTPLLDIIFTLLFFFFLAMNVREDRSTVQVTLPALAGQGVAAAQRTSPKRVTVILTSDNQIFLSDQPMPLTPEQLSASLAQRRQAGATELRIRTDTRAPAGLLVDLMKRGPEAGFPDAVVEYTEDTKSANAQP